MYYNKYKLYCPIPTLAGGESDEGGGYGEDGNGEDGNGDEKVKERLVKVVELCLMIMVIY